MAGLTRGSRRAFAAHDVLAARARLAGADRADRDQRAAASDPDAAALLQARARGAARALVLSRGSQDRRRRHRGPVASVERQPRRLQQREVGQKISRVDRARSEEARGHAPRRLHSARRHRGGGSDHVARDARRALAARAKNPPELLLADDDGDGGGAVRGTGLESRDAGETYAPTARRGMNEQLKGVEKLDGTYLFDLAASARALRLNRFLHGLTDAGNR